MEEKISESEKSSLSEYIFGSMKDKLRSPLYATFLIVFITWNWDIFVTLFFVSDESIVKQYGLIKSVYIHDVMIWNKDWMYQNFRSYASGYGMIGVWRYGIPVILTWLAFRILPYISNWAHGLEKDFSLKREKNNSDYEAQIKALRLTMLNSDTYLKNAFIVNSSATEQVVSHERNKLARRKSDYFEFVEKYPGVAEGFERLYNFVYTKNGKILGSKVPASVNTWLQHELISRNSIGTYFLTEKGIFYIEMDRQQNNKWHSTSSSSN